MNKRLSLFLLTLVVLFIANIAWRVWSSWGLITLDIREQPLGEVMRRVEKQAGIRLRSNLPADTKITMHVRKVSLLHALEILAANAGGNWSVGYFAAPDKGTIENALTTLASGQEVEGWKRWSLPPMRGMGEDEAGSSDPRTEKWQVQPAAAATLHSYLEQASHVLSAQFWAPEQWNPAITAPPAAGKIKNVLPKLAKAAHGESAEVFLLRGRPQGPRNVADAASGQDADRRSRPDRPPGGGPGGFDNDEMRKVMEERERARIERLPKAKQEEALARLEERRKFFEELAQLTPEERRAKIEERMEQAMNNSDTAQKMSAEGTKRGAMKSADQRSEGYRGYLDRKRERN